MEQNVIIGKGPPHPPGIATLGTYHSAHRFTAPRDGPADTGRIAGAEGRAGRRYWPRIART